MDKATVETLVANFRSTQYLYERLAHHVRRFLVGQVNTKFDRSDWPILHDHKDRAKDPTSLYQNLMANRYKPPPTRLSEIKDLAGARLIFFFRDDLDKFWNSLHLYSSFGELADKTQKKALEPSSGIAEGELFGYDSFHFTCEVSTKTEFWEALTDEDKGSLTGFRCEVQLRTILQHTWAEAEHDLRYKVQNKTELAFPSNECRNWGILAAMLEGADVMLVERKKYYENLPRSRQRGVSEKWKYPDPEHGALLGDIRYEYQILHMANDAVDQNMPLIEQNPEIFDIDKAMEIAGEALNYKKRMWAQLRKQEPDFIVSSFTHDSTVVRAKDWNESGATLTVQPAQYSDQMVTNHKRALKQAVGSAPGRKVKDLAYKNSGEFLPFAESPMSNTIGVAGMVFTTDEKWVIGLRSRKVAFDPGQWGCSASGALEWAGPENWCNRNEETWIKEALARECAEELGFRPSSDQIHYLAFAREFGRAGKPQFFFLINAPVVWRDIEFAWQIYSSDERELSKIMSLDKEQAKSLVGKDADNIASIILNVGLSEELRMNLALALQYVATAK